MRARSGRSNVAGSSSFFAELADRGRRRARAGGLGRCADGAVRATAATSRRGADGASRGRGRRCERGARRATARLVVGTICQRHGGRRGLRGRARRRRAKRTRGASAGRVRTLSLSSGRRPRSGGRALRGRGCRGRGAGHARGASVDVGTSRGRGGVGGGWAAVGRGGVRLLVRLRRRHWSLGRRYGTNWIKSSQFCCFCIKKSCTVRRPRRTANHDGY